jgi:transcriptional regulator with XRE-family HTH domain
MQKPAPKAAFGLALRSARKAKGLTQEDFDVESSRVYISAIERGVKVPTLNTVDKLAEVLGLHPLSLLTLSYLADPHHLSEGELDKLLKQVRSELSPLIDSQ